jgi:GT2 family glycosyltransferase
VDICFANISPGNVATSFMQSLRACDREKVFTSDLLHITGPYLDVGRNVLVEEFYHDKSLGDYMLWVDSDITFSPENVRELAAHADPERIVSGIYMNYFGDYKELRPVVGRFTYDEKLKAEAIKPVPTRVLDDVDSEGLVKVDGCGAGFMMYHRQLIDVMVQYYGYPMPWFICQCLEQTKQWYGEDYMFCLRAAALGYQTYAVPSVRVGHNKVVQL